MRYATSPNSGRQVLDCGEERELDRLAADHPRVRLEFSWRGRFEQGVRERLQPRKLRRRRPGGDLRRRRLEVRRQYPARPARVQAGVGRDLVQPGPQTRTAREAVPRPPSLQKRLLDKILGFVERTEHPV